jgi:D-cysteine desulfhydrase
LARLEVTMTLEDLINQPRVALANLPTPIVPVPHGWGDVRLYLKRDDLTGCATSGNKIRKLEYLIADAKAQGCDTLITCGGVQSNHSRATAVAAAMTGMRSVLVLAGEEPRDLDGNLLLSRMVGAEVRIVPPMEGEQRHARMLDITRELEAAGRKPYVVVAGGSDELGALGYVRAMNEIGEQLAEDPRGIGCIVHACGSGGTYVGSFVGHRLAGVKPRLVAAIAEGDIAGWRRTLLDYITRTAKRWNLDVSAEAGDIELLDAAGLGYAINTDEEIDFIVRFARQTGILLDPVYTGKSLYVLDRAIRDGTFDPGGNVLFVHTGGAFSLFPERRRLSAAMD